MMTTRRNQPAVKVTDTITTVLTCVKPGAMIHSPVNKLSTASRTDLTMSSKPKSGSSKRAQRRMMDPSGFTR